MAKQKYALGFILLVILTSSVYLILNDQVRIDIQNTRSIFQIYEDGKWVVSGIEYVNLFDGTAKMRASERNIEYDIFGNTTIITRTALYKQGIFVIERYLFNGSDGDVELFPVEHSIEVIGADRPDRPFILQYEVQKLLYEGETVKDVESPQSFGHKMEVEWDDGNYYSRIFKYKDRDEGKLTVKYRIDSDRFSKKVRLFDPPGNMTVTLNSPEDDFISESTLIVFNSSANATDLVNMSLYWNKTGIWEIANTTELDSFIDGLVSYYEFDEQDDTGIGTIIDSVGDVNLTNNGATNSSGKINTAYSFDGNNDYMPNPPLLGENFTLSLWVNFDVTSGDHFIYAKDDGSTSDDIEFRLTRNTDGFDFTLGNTANSAFTVSERGLSASVWYYVIVTFDGTNLTLYVNGTSVNTTTFTGTRVTASSIAYIARRESGLYYDGRLDEISVYNRTLSQSEITNQYNSGLARRPTIDFSSQTWDNLINGSTLWNVEACNASSCGFAPENFTVFLDEQAPLVNITFPEAITYTVNVSDLNYTISDSYPDDCWYSINNGATNSTAVTAGQNFVNVTSIEGENNWTVYCNDTGSRENSSTVTFLKDSLPPQIEYAANSDETNESGNFDDKDWIFVNVTVNESSVANVSFILWTSVNVSFNETIFTNQADNYDINWTSLPENMYFWNVTVCEDFGRCNTTATRSYGVEVTNLSLELNFSNILAELGGGVQVNATNNLGIVCVDVDHPDYGVNFSCDTFSTGFDLIINYFRSNIFNDSSISKTLNFVGEQIKTVFFPAHQYDEVDGMSFNITGINTTNYPENVQINSSNISTIDRLFTGFLIGSHIYQDRDIGNDTEINLIYANIGVKTVNFFMDDGALLIGMIFNVTGIEFGIDFQDSFVNDTYIDLIQTTAQIDKSATIMPANSSLTEFIYDDFEDGSIDTNRWIKTDDFSDSGGGWTISATISETSGYIKMRNTWSNPSEEVEGSTLLDFGTKNSSLTLYDSENIVFNLSSTYSSLSDTIGCSGNTFAFLGGTNIWTNYYEPDNGVFGNDEESSQADMTFNLTKQNSTHWRIKISGIETSSVERFGECGIVSGTYNWTNGSFFISKQNCANDIGTLDNDFFSSIDYENFNSFTIRNEVVLSNDKCKSNTIETRIYYSNNSLWSRENSTFISESVYDSSGDITSATLGANGLNVSNETTSFFLSADDGDNWEAVTLDLLHSFTFTGTNLRWRVDFNITNPGFKNVTSRVTDVTLTTPKGFPSNITFDFGNDGIIDATISGELNTTNGTVTVNVSSADLTSALNITPIIGNHLIVVPLKITSDSIGQIDISSINLTYNPNPISLSITAILNFISNSIGFIDFPISIESIGGNITLDDVRYDYAGGNDTIEVKAHNTDYSINLSRNITYYYSRWEYDWGPTGVEWIYFAPPNPNATNVTPYGQASNTPILNITNLGYGGRNATLSVYQDETSPCTDVTMSLDNNKSNGFLLDESFITLGDLSYLEVAQIYMWADYSCSFDTWNLYDPNYYFRLCVEGGSCAGGIL